jgi:hypothetical protein
MTQLPDCVSSDRVLAAKLRKRLAYFQKFYRKIVKVETSGGERDFFKLAVLLIAVRS